METGVGAGIGCDEIGCEEIGSQEIGVGEGIKREEYEGL